MSKTMPKQKPKRAVKQNVKAVPQAKSTRPAPKSKTPEQLRSFRWLGPDDLRSFGHRSRLKQMGYSAEDYAGKPVIGILNTWNEFNPATRISRSAPRRSSAASGRPAVFRSKFPSSRISETFMKPWPCFIATCWRMETEEMLRVLSRSTARC